MYPTPYTTKRQREVLESIGIVHVKGRSNSEAQSLIKQAIRDGRLPATCLDEPATERQLNYLRELRVAPTSGLTKEQASQLIEAQHAERDKLESISDRQFDFIYELGGIPDERMSRYEASQYIDYLLDNGTRCPNCDNQYDRRGERCPGCGRYMEQQQPLPPPFQIYQSKHKPLPNAASLVEQLLRYFSR